LAPVRKYTKLKHSEVDFQAALLAEMRAAYGGSARQAGRLQALERTAANHVEHQI